MLTFGVSVSISQILHVASPDPVAAYRPVGECAQHNIGDAWPSHQLKRDVGLPLRVALHLPTLRTRNTAWGSHHSSKTSSGEKVGAVDVEAGGARASVKMDELICTRAEVGAVAVGETFGIKWKEYGKGSSL